MSAKPTFIDLFCGCGGFTLGVQRAGFDCLAAVDFNAKAVATLRANLQKIAEGLQYQDGEITLQGGIAKIHLPNGFRFLDPKNAEVVLSKIWGNPPGAKTLGMLVPTDISPASASAWAVILTYDEDGYVKDDDAEKIDYTKLLKEMQESTTEASKEREKQGFGSIQLIGWATPPRYDKSSHKMYWAKELKFDGSDENTLNYNIRLLGRRGVLVLNAVAGMEQLPAIQSATPTLLSMIDFQEGHRYSDFDSSSDKVATYGLAALVAGGIATKAGLFKGLFVALLAAKKFVIMGVIAIGAYLKKVFGKKTEQG